MYNNKLVASVKTNGKIMREDGETVYLPFGSEYSLLFKNLNTQRAVVTIEIDGTDVIPGGLVINANQTLDLERFVIQGDLNKGPRFKFTEKTQEISDHRGDKIEDGIVRIQYQFEKPQTIYYAGYYRAPWETPLGGSTGGTCRGMNISAGNSTSTYSSQSVDGASFGPETETLTAGTAGITTHGTDSSQSFTTTTMGAMETTKHTIVFNLKGGVAQPVTVDLKITCDDCGKVSKSSSKFCDRCGKNLTYQY